MEQAEQGYQQMPEEDTTFKAKAKRCLRSCEMYTGLVLFVVAVLTCLLQAAMYEFAAMKCKPSLELQNYSYPGGGHKELVPNNTLLIQQDPRWWGSAFIVQPADHVGLATGASTGVWYRTWGPLWYTYVYQDDLGMETFMARDRPLALGGSHQIFRCDGMGSTYIVSEGNHVLMNRIRAIFGMYTARVYNIWQDGQLVAISEKIGGTGQSHKQLIYRDPKKADPFASAFLQERHYHGQYDKWFIHDEKNPLLPAWVINSATVLMAFPTAQAKLAHKQPPAPPSSLLEAKPPTATTEEAIADEAVVPSLPSIEAVQASEPTATAPSSEEAVVDEAVVPSLPSVEAPAQTENAGRREEHV